jgi:hypothetical protein
MDFSTVNDSHANINVRLIGFSLRDNLMYVEERVTGDRFRLMSYNPAEDRVVDVLLEDDFYDIDGISRFNVSARELLGVSLLLDKRKSIWFDKAMREYQRKVDALRPETINHVYEWSRDLEYLMVHRFNGKGIDMIDIYATKADAITTLSDRSRGLSEYTLGETRKINYRAQDGYTLEGFLTIPPGSNGKALPLVVTTPDNAWSKQVEGYGADIQFFATRGYAVFRPNYRGTTGRGRKHNALDSANLSA